MSKLSPFKTIAQGGQVHLHQLRMLKQVLAAGVIAAFMFGGGTFLWKSSQISPVRWRMAYEVVLAEVLLAFSPEYTHKFLSQPYTSPQGFSFKRNCLSIVRDPRLKKNVKRLEVELKKAASFSLYTGGGCFIGVICLWYFLGYSLRQKKHQRGNIMVPWKQLASLLRRQWQASDLKLGRLPFVKGKETSHILITGTTGAGKTNTFHTLLPQIRRRGDYAIVLDVTGDYMSRYYDETRDILLNPLDIRSHSWNPWADCHFESHYETFAESLIQTKEGSRDPFWDNASRILLKTALRKYAAQGNHNIEQLTNFLLTASETEFEDFFKDTEALTFSFKNNEKTTNSIRSVLASQVTSLRQIKATNEAFSIRKWIKNAKRKASWSIFPKKKEWIFMTARADQRQALVPLLSSWIDIAINSLMSLPEDPKRRVWFIIDELAALHCLPRLSMGLAEGRKYGGCFLIGFQSKPQLEDIYGKNIAEAMLDLCNTKIFFRCTEPATQQWISRVLGDKEEQEPLENISYGAHSMRDGVSLSLRSQQTSLVLPAELSLLKDLECYLKYPGNYPCTKFQSSYQKPPRKKQEAFLLRKEESYIAGPPTQVAASNTDYLFKEEAIYEEMES